MITPPETLLKLLFHYSPTGQESQAVEALIKTMLGLGFSSAYQDEAGNAVGVMGEGSLNVLLLGHIDTVPGEIKVKQVGDLLYGRGSVDAKGPLAAFVDAVAAIGSRPGWRMTVIGAVEEEGGSKGARFVAEGEPADFVIIGEPSRWDRVTLGYKGSAWAEIRTEKPIFHTAGRGKNACEQLFDCWSEVQQYANGYNESRPAMFSQVQPTLRSIRSGEDSFMEWASMQIGARLPIDLSPAQWFNLLSSLCPESSMHTLGYPMPAYRAEKNNHLVRQFLHAIRNAEGNPSFVHKSGTADFNIIGPAWKCPIVAYGPGDSNLDHTPDEHISITEYYKSVNVLKNVLINLTGGR